VTRPSPASVRRHPGRVRHGEGVRPPPRDLMRTGPGAQCSGEVPGYGTERRAHTWSGRNRVGRSRR
jgi:hypothetical protein